jgi:hypothetical protein
VRLARFALALALGLAVSSGAGEAIAAKKAPESSLSIWSAGAWRTWWRSDRAPARWTAADPMITRALEWRRLDRGLEWASLRLACGAPAWRARLIIARLDPRELTLSLDMSLTRDDARPAWTVDQAPDDAVLAVNAGQFLNTMPWGWVLMDGTQRLRPGHGPLSSSIAIDAVGRVRWAHGDSIPAEGVITGFQSYPTLLAGDGAVPPALRAAGAPVSLTHHDARLALGQTRDGKLVLVMTRFDVMGEAVGGFPMGPTTPEMAAIMGALGATDAVMLDGGISAQLLLRGAGHQEPLRWRGLRKVPLALIARPRPPVEALAR